MESAAAVKGKTGILTKNIQVFTNIHYFTA